MPGTDGLTTVEEIHKLAGHENVPVIIITGEPTQRIQASAARLGALDFIPKDSLNSPEQIERLIDKVIGWAQRLSGNNH